MADLAARTPPEAELSPLARFRALRARLAPESRGGRRFLWAAAFWFAAGAVTLLWPDRPETAGSGLTSDFAALELLIGALFLAAIPLERRLGASGRWLVHNAPRFAALAVVLTLWQIASAKTGYWPKFFPPPQGVAEVYFKETPRLLVSLRDSLILLAFGVALGAAAGFLTGLATGWSRRVGYWTKPVLRLIGPIPATAIIPIALFLFPTNFSASVFLVALATWFSVAVLTWSGVGSVEPAYYDVARTLGASEAFLLARVAVPAALPHVFVGLFMGLGSALSVLVAAEMVGVQAGLGYFIEWAQSWGAYGHMFAGLLIMAALFSLLISGLFRLRDAVLAGQEGDVKW